ncbi:MAG TPA: ABC transporter permease [Candidatus Acidoferrum sp.]|nr:ABC transporter permease [Candidatus Acidoferrum sp.]
MLRYLINRLAQSIVLIVFVSILTFVLIHAAPGGPAVLLAPEMTKEQIELARKQLGLDDPIPLQYARWAGHVVRGNLGTSYSQGLPVTDLLLRRLPETLELVLTGLALATMAGILIGIVSAKRQYSLLDKLSTGFCFFGMSVPVFWFGLMLIIFLSIDLKILPSAGSYTLGAPASIQDRFVHLILPAIVLATANLALIARYTRSSMLEVLHADYLRTARAKGVKESVVMNRHALRNALIPIVTVVGLMIPRLVSGVAITESVFAWPGMGSLAVDSAVQRDYPVVMGITLMVSVLVVVTNLLTDLSYLFLDPRVKLR